MNIEIERKYQVDVELLKKSVDLLTMTPRVYTQTYLCAKPAVRITVRQCWEGGKLLTADKAWFTVKSAGALIREEYEYDVPVEDGQKLLNFNSAQITKTRFRIPAVVAGFDGSTQLWEVDCYHGAHEGLWTAEVELPEIDTQVLLPPWVGQEITYDSRFSNMTLAFQGMPRDLKLADEMNRKSF